MKAHIKKEAPDSILTELLKEIDAVKKSGHEISHVEVTRAEWKRIRKEVDLPYFADDVYGANLFGLELRIVDEPVDIKV